MLRSIMEGRYEFVSPEWDEISDHAKHLVCVCGWVWVGGICVSYVLALFGGSYNNEWREHP